MLWNRGARPPIPWPGRVTTSGVRMRESRRRNNLSQPAGGCSICLFLAAKMEILVSSGTLEPGKLADFVVLDKDFLTVPDEEIGKITSVMTIVGGKVIHDALK